MKVSIVGTGNVGASLAYVCVLQGLADELVLFNRNQRLAEGHALDLQHTISMTPHSMAIRSGDITAMERSDVIVVTASAQLAGNMDRRALAPANAEIIRDWLPRLVDGSPDAIILIITNPVDSMVWAALELTALPPEKVAGIGTLVDSARLRALISRKLQIHPDDIRAYVLGEHGNSQVPATSVASIGGVRLQEAEPEVWRFTEQVINSGTDIVGLKGYTNFAVAKATALVLDSIRHDHKKTLPLSVRLDDYYGIDDVCLSIPVVVGRAGVLQQLHPQLTADELAAFQASASAVRLTNDTIRPIIAN